MRVGACTLWLSRARGKAMDVADAEIGVHLREPRSCSFAAQSLSTDTSVICILQLSSHKTSRMVVRTADTPFTEPELTLPQKLVVKIGMELEGIESVLPEEPYEYFFNVRERVLATVAGGRNSA